MQDKYISQIDPLKSSIIFTYLRDIETIYTQYQKKQIKKDTAIELVFKQFEYLKGFLFGLGVKHNRKIFFNDGDKFDYLSFYSNSSHSVKYTICINLTKFYVLYTRKDFKNGTV